MNRRRQWHQSGPQPITYQEIQAYIMLKFSMAPQQIQQFVRFVEELDDVYLEDYLAKQGTNK